MKGVAGSAKVFAFGLVALFGPDGLVALALGFVALLFDAVDLAGEGVVLVLDVVALGGDVFELGFEGGDATGELGDLLVRGPSVRGRLAVSSRICSSSLLARVRSSMVVLRPSICPSRLPRIESCWSIWELSASTWLARPSCRPWSSSRSPWRVSRSVCSVSALGLKGLDVGVALCDLVVALLDFALECVAFVLQCVALGLCLFELLFEGGEFVGVGRFLDFDLEIVDLAHEVAPLFVEPLAVFA